MKKKLDDRGTTRLDSLVLLIVITINKSLRVLADILQARTSKLSFKTQQWLLATFCLLFVSASTYVIIRSLEAKADLPIISTPIRPMQLIKDSQKQGLISEAEYRRLHRFKVYMDSLQIYPGGSPIRDSILQEHPHLMDSIEYLESIYYQQTKK